MTEFQWRVVLALCRIVVRMALDRPDSRNDIPIILEALDQVDRPPK